MTHLDPHGLSRTLQNGSRMLTMENLNGELSTSRELLRVTGIHSDASATR